MEVVFSKVCFTRAISDLVLIPAHDFSESGWFPDEVMFFPGGRERSGKWGYVLLQPVYREEPVGTSGFQSTASTTTTSTFSITVASRLARGDRFYFRYSLESVLQSVGVDSYSTPYV